MTEKECRCTEKGQPMTDLGVMHTEDCEWFVWFRSTGGCMGDDDYEPKVGILYPEDAHKTTTGELACGHRFCANNPHRESHSGPDDWICFTCQAGIG